MDHATRQNALRLALRAFALVFIFAVYPLTIWWPSGWCWTPGRSDYLQMIVALYATLGVFLWLAARDPQRHVALIAFTIWSSVVHAGVMAVQSVSEPGQMGHLLGDVPALFVVAIVLGALSPDAARLRL